MKKEVVATPNAPKALGPYSQAVKVGETLYCSGQIGLDPRTGALVADDVVEQAKQALRNLKAVLKQAQVSDVVKVTVFMTNIADFQKVNEVYAEFFKESQNLPARSAVGVKALPAKALVEIEAVAVK